LRVARTAGPLRELRAGLRGRGQREAARLRVVRLAVRPAADPTRRALHRPGARAGLLHGDGYRIEQPELDRHVLVGAARLQVARPAGAAVDARGALDVAAVQLGGV